MEDFFKGKRALVTGGSQGIGRGIAEKLAKLGVQVFVFDKIPANYDSPSIKHTLIDLTDWEGTKKAVEAILPVDFLVNNAGVAIHYSIFELTEEQFDNTFAINTKAPLCIMQSVVKDLAKRKQPGAIVNISSIAAKAALQDHIVYCGAKGAVDAMTRCAALEFGPYNIRVNSINPTITDTELGRRVWADAKAKNAMLERTPINKFAEVEDIVNSVIFLLSDYAGMITGTSVPIDGGFLAC